MVGYAVIYSQTLSHSYSVQGSWEESLSLESALFANPSELPCKTPLNDSLLIVKQMDINKVPYKYSKTSYTHTHSHKMRVLIHDQLKTLTEKISLNYLYKF